MNENSESKKIKIKIDPDLADLIPEFLDRRQQDVSELLNAVQRMDFQTVTTIGHQMKGSGSGYGFDYLSELGEKIEEEAMASRMEKIPDLAEKLAGYLKRLDISYE